MKFASGGWKFDLCESAMEKLKQTDLDELIDVLRSCGVIYAVLFGSASRDELRPDSDLDLAVAAAGPLSAATRYNVIDRVSAISGRPVDLVDLKTARGLVLARALQGKELFCDSIRAKGDALFRRVSVAEEDIAYARKAFSMARPRMFE